MSDKTPHTWVDANTMPQTLHCDRCGRREPLALPMSVDFLVASLDAFARLHAGCEPKEPEPSR